MILLTVARAGDRHQHGRTSQAIIRYLGGNLPAASPPDPAVATALVVVVDNDSNVRDAMAELVASGGYAVRLARDGIQLLQMIQNERVDIVLLDVNMPRLHGIEVCRRLRAALGYDVGIIFLSGERPEPWDRIAGLEAGGDDYIIKPFDPGELLARIGALARRLHTGQGALEERTFASRSPLTPRQSEVLSLLAEGAALQDIASRLFISPRTVRKHIERIYRALGVRSRGEAVAWAFNEGLVLPSGSAASRGSSGSPVTLAKNYLFR